MVPLAIHFIKPRALIVHRQVRLKQCAILVEIHARGELSPQPLFRASMGEASMVGFLPARERFANFIFKL